MKPDFICAGFIKCGTTTLYDILKQHKELRFAKDDIKEPMFFSDDVIYSKGVYWYKSRYYGSIKKELGVLIGEINPSLDIYVERIRRTFDKNTKIIFIMRNPVDSAFSAYKFFGKEGNGFDTNEDFNDYISLSHEKGFENYVKRNLSTKSNQKLVYKGLRCWFLHRQNYYRCIKNYLKYYPIKNLKFIVFEEFISNPKDICEEIYEFLGIDKTENINYDIKSNENRTVPRCKIAARYFGKLSLIYNKLWQTTCLYSKHPKIWNAISIFYSIVKRILLKPDNDNSKMNAQTRKILEEYYRGDKIGIESLIGRSLDEVWFK